MNKAAKVIVELTKLLDNFPVQGTYEPKQIPQQIAEKLNEK